jgi:phosphatidylethanolamine/phosphatidyl-N-methylethanolamine N-methyltransferase
MAGMQTNKQSVAGPGRQVPQGSRPFTASGWLDGAEFLRGFLRNPAQVGSVIPSSAMLERRLVRHAGIAQARSVVELGPGTGGTTAALLRAMPADGRLLAIELDPRFHRYVAAALHDPRLALELASAEQIAELLAARGMDPPDAIVSGIPFSTMPPEVSRRIAGLVAQVLRPGGRFVAYQVVAHVTRFLTPELGPPLRKEWEWFNVPPVRVFTWVKAQAAGR